jgi:hypothetical protein
MNIIDFLKVYSKINNEFIDDFFGLYNDEDKFGFSIDIEAVAKWMNMRKGTIKDTLVHTYKENIDFLIIKEKKRIKSGNQRKLFS